MNIHHFLLSLVLVPLLLSPGISTAGDHKEIGTSQWHFQSSDWLFLVYMDADNNLAGAADANLAQMMEAGSDTKVSILVLLDKNTFGDSRLYYVKKNALELVDDGGAVIPDTKEVNMGSPETLRNFLNFSRKYPRNHTFLVLWDHGNGWKGFCTDSQSKDSLNLTEIAEVLEEFDIDVLGVDACQGALMEVVYALRNSARYFVGSQKDEPENGWNYTLLLNLAKNFQNLTPEKFAVAAVDAFQQHYKNYSFLSVPVALSAINLTKVEMLAEAIDNFSLALSAGSFLLRSEIFDARNSTETYEGDSRSDVDLGDFAKKSLNSSYILIRKEAGKVLSLLNDVVLKSCGISAVLSSTSVRADNASGLSIYFPCTSFDSKYMSTDFAREKNWSDFLLDFLGPPSLPLATLEVRVMIENTTIFIENPGNALIYICDSRGEVVWCTDSRINYTAGVPDYYEVLGYNFTGYNGKSYLNGIFRSERIWVGETRPNIKIGNVEFFREDGVRVLGNTGKHPVENRSFTFKLTLTNDGDVNVTTGLKIVIGNFTWLENLTVAVNTNLSIWHALSLPFGEFKILVLLDPDNSIRETNETDNLYITTFWVKSRVPLRGITVVLRNAGISEYQIYNETGALLAEGRIVENAEVSIPASGFAEGDYIYIHIFSGGKALFRKIQVFSEDERYEVTFGARQNDFSQIDYIFLVAVAALIAIFALCFAFVLWKILTARAKFR